MFYLNFFRNMNEEISEKLLTTVDGADIVQSIKNFPTNVVSDHEGAEKVIQ